MSQPSARSCGRGLVRPKTSTLGDRQSPDVLVAGEHVTRRAVQDHADGVHGYVDGRLAASTQVQGA
jgi:hypothetical protein